MPLRTPPGRAGRIWLADRIDTAHRAAELLEHKQQLLRRERRRLAALVAQTGREWRDRAVEAERWSAKALVAGGRGEIARAEGRSGAARAAITWASQVGVRYPGTVTLEAPPPLATPSPAVARAADAAGRALEAAVRHAAAEAALDRVGAELAATTRRLRAVRDRWLPELDAALAAADLRLDETEREEITRLRWAAPPEGVA